MASNATHSGSKRTIPITMLAAIAAMAVVKDLFDLFGKPVDLSEFKDRTKDRQAVKDATQKIYAAILALKPNRTAAATD